MPGTVLRTADAAGAGAVVFTDASVDPYNGKCVRSSAGSLFHPAVVRGGAAEEVVAALRAAGLRVLAADGAGERDLDDLADAGELAAPTAWLFGNEARGLPDELAALARRPGRHPDPRPRREPQPGRGRRGLPLRERPRPALTRSLRLDCAVRLHNPTAGSCLWTTLRESIVPWETWVRRKEMTP